MLSRLRFTQDDIDLIQLCVGFASDRMFEHPNNFKKLIDRSKLLLDRLQTDEERRAAIIDPK